MVIAVTVVGTVLTRPRSARAAGAQSTDTGRTLYSRDCAVCHGAAGEGSFRGPPIKDSGQAAVDFMLTTGRMPLTEPARDVPRRSPRYSTDEIRSLLAYTGQFVTGPAVPTVDTTGADLAKGGELYRLNCASCHQAVGAGGALAYGTTAPPLDQATPAQVVEAMRVGPGSMPVFSSDQVDDAAAAGVAAYVGYLRHPDDRGGLGLGHLGPVPEGLVAWLVGLGSLLFFVRWLGTREPLK